MPHAQSDAVKAAHSELANCAAPYDHSDGNFYGSWATMESTVYIERTPAQLGDAANTDVIF